MLDALKDGERASGDLVMGAGCPAGWHARRGWRTSRAARCGGYASGGGRGRPAAAAGVSAIARRYDGVAEDQRLGRGARGT